MKTKTKQLIEAFYYLEEHPEESLTSVSKKFNVDRHSLSGPTKDTFKNYSIESVTNPNNLYWFTEEELAVVNYYVENDNATYIEIFQKFGLPKKSTTFANWLKILGIEKRQNYKYTYNRSIFSVIDTEEKAYWLGFILADGYLNEERNFLQIKLGNKDKEHLFKFAKFMGFSDEQANEAIKQDFGGAYTRDNVCWVIKINSKEVVEDLKKYNIFQAKSTNEIPFKLNNIELEKHYIRGILDGDGFIRQSLNGFGVVGSYNVLKYIKDFINQNIINIQGNSIMEKGTIYTFELNNREKSKIILDYLYQDASVYLERKYKLYIAINCRV